MARPLKLYNHTHAPNPRRVRIFAAEKGIALSLEEVDILAGQSRMPEFLARNSSGAVPVLELDDGSDLREQAENTNPLFQKRIKQFQEYGESQRAVVYQRLERMDHELNGREFIASDRFTIADITALVAIDFGSRLANIQIAPTLAHLTRWHETVSKRSSAGA